MNRIKHIEQQLVKFFRRFGVMGYLFGGLGLIMFLGSFYYIYNSVGQTDSNIAAGGMVSSPNSGTFEQRWQQDAPVPYQSWYSNFFSGNPTEEIYRNQLKVAWALYNGLKPYEGQYWVSRVQNAYRDPEYNRRIGGDSGSFHMQGLAIDFFWNVDTKDMSEATMMQIGKALNEQNLRVIWYPFRTSDRSTHVQWDTKYKIIYFRGRGEKGYWKSYNEASRQ